MHTKVHLFIYQRLHIKAKLTCSARGKVRSACDAARIEFTQHPEGRREKGHAVNYDIVRSTFYPLVIDGAEDNIFKPIDFAEPMSVLHKLFKRMKFNNRVDFFNFAIS